MQEAIITETAIPVEEVINKVKDDSNGCVVVYVGLIRDRSHGKQVLSVEYQDSTSTAEETLRQIADQAKQTYEVTNIAICHRIGKLSVGEINLVVAVASAHRKEAFTACQYMIDRFKQRLPTRKIEIYQNGEVKIEEITRETRNDRKIKK
jgi:molybdopterin synthase catalytic subunit